MVEALYSPFNTEAYHSCEEDPVMAQPSFKVCLEETLTMAFACRDKKTRSAYLALADFYEEQAMIEAQIESCATVEVFR